MLGNRLGGRATDRAGPGSPWGERLMRPLSLTRTVGFMTPTATQVGERFAQALAAKDATALKALLAPGVDFRAMTPTRFWEATDPDEIVDEDLLGMWFSPEREIVSLLAVDHDASGPVERVGYRLHVRRPDGDFVVEQQAYYQSEGERISWLRIMCSGFAPAG